jgi:fibronectin-binding autotransporter adhesin
VLTVAGDYESRGGTLQLEAVLGDDDSAADRLVVRGSTSGSTLVDVANLGGAGAQTVDGILVVEVDASNGVFSLLRGDVRLGGENALVAGAYAYVLRQVGPGGDWRLRSSVSGEVGPPSVVDPNRPGGEPGAPVDPTRPQTTLYQPGVPIYEAYPQVLQALNGLPTMRQRIGARQGADAEYAGVWGRVEKRHLKVEPAVSTSGATLKTDPWKVQFGIDQILADEVAGGQLVGGLTAHYAEVESSVASPHGGGRVEAKAYGAGATLTWTGATGAYVDAQAQLSWYETDLRSSVLAIASRTRMRAATPSPSRPADPWPREACSVSSRRSS